MNPPLTRFSWQRLLRDAIAHAVVARSEQWPALGDRYSQPVAVPVKRIQRITTGVIPHSATSARIQSRIQYGSAIAPKVSPEVGQPPRDVARVLVQPVADAIACMTAPLMAAASAMVANNSEQPSLGQPLDPNLLSPSDQEQLDRSGSIDGSDVLGRSLVTVEAAPAGWLLMSLSDRGIAVWLQAQHQGLARAQHVAEIDGSPRCDPDLYPDQRVRTDVGTPSGARSVEGDRIWQGQYAHARCCALQRLADTTPLGWDQPNWMDGKALRLQTEPDVQLIASLLDAVDACGDQTNGDRSRDDAVAIQRKLVQNCQALSQNVLRLYNCSPLFGELLTHDPQLAIARLGLFQIARSRLRDMLEQGLGAIAPDSL